jgi:hypothetical protein
VPRNNTTAPASWLATLARTRLGSIGSWVNSIIMSNVEIPYPPLTGGISATSAFAGSGAASAI